MSSLKKIVLIGALTSSSLCSAGIFDWWFNIDRKLQNNLNKNISELDRLRSNLPTSSVLISLIDFAGTVATEHPFDESHKKEKRIREKIQNTKNKIFSQINKAPARLTLKKVPNLWSEPTYCDSDDAKIFQAAYLECLKENPNSKKACTNRYNEMGKLLYRNWQPETIAKLLNENCDT